MHEWVGLGPSAASQHAGWRGSNVADLADWLARLERGERATEDRTRLTAELLAEDALIFGLRMNEGVDLEEIRRRSPSAPWTEIDELLSRLVDEALAERRGGMRFALTLRGRLIADAIGSEIMNAFSPPAGAASAAV
jgi:oxygen-independent coproporphyrinogen-3 oxidase